MERIKTIFVRVHIALWILFSLLLMLQLSQENAYWPALTADTLLTSLYAFYSHFFLLTRYPAKAKKGPYFLMLAGIISTGPLLYILLHPRKLDTVDLLAEYYFISMFSIVIPFIFLSWLARVTENLVLNTFKKEQLEKQAVESELYYLRSQINPHFLFNTLNNIHTLVYKQAPTAPEAVMHLASLMRYMIYESNAPTVPLAREIEYLQDYVNLQQLRYKEGPVVDVNIDGDTRACHIAPLLFIHLLENAYKHSPARLGPGDLKVNIVVQEAMLSFSVQNPVGKTATHIPDETGGIGLPNVRKRLALLYPDQHTFEVHRTNGTFTALLQIQGIQLKPHERKANVLHH